MPENLAPDTILLNGRILTMASADSRVEAVSVRGDRVVATGSSAELKELAGPRTQVIDLAGRTVVPGLHDPHLHLAGEARSYGTLDVRYWFTNFRSNAQ